MRRARLVVVALILGFPSALAAQIPAGGEFLVNAHTLGNQMRPSVAFGPAGDFVVAWDSSPYCPQTFPPPPCTPAQDGDRAGVFTRRFDASGSPQGGEFQVNTVTYSIQYYAAVAGLSDGRYIVAWESWAPQDGSGMCVVARFLDRSGRPVGSEFIANATTAGSQRQAAVASQPGGNFIVVWSDQNTRVAGRRFNGTGAPIGGEFEVFAWATPNVLGRPRVTTDAAGNFVVAWQGHPGGTNPEIFARRFAASGTPIGASFQVNSYTTGNQILPDVSGDAAGNFVVVWKSSNNTSARRYDASAMPLGPEFQVSAFPGLGGTAVAASRNGGFLVSWSDSSGLRGRRYDRAGLPEPEFFVGSAVEPSRFDVAVDDAGNTIVAWWRFPAPGDGSGAGVLARRYGGLSPAALAVDAAGGGGSNGNGVLEAGETVGVAPSWRNVSGNAQDFNGAAFDFTGPGAPSDPAYTIVDASASYGVVANGATVSCGAQCYAVRVGVPATRPVLHWDAGFGEDIFHIFPAILGQSKTWALHVGDSFPDVPRTSPFYRFVETILHKNVTGGCTPAAYCPTSATNRQQMAVFVLASKEPVVPPPCGATPMFADVPVTSPFCRWVEELARRGVVTGCGGGNYCPFSPATREQMAAFVLRTLDPALNPPACGTPMFADVPASSPFCRWIEELARRGVVTGCGGGNYCPTLAVNRQQMSVFLSVTFGLTLYGP